MNTIPNWISLTRILFSPLLLWLGWTDRGTPFLAVLALLLLTDFLDGYLARKLNQESKLGVQLDTTGDVLISFQGLLGGWWLWPERMANEAPFFFVALGFLAISGLAALIKYRHFPSYHTHSAKLATFLVGVGIWIFFAGMTPWLLRIALLVLIYSAIEELVITLTFAKWHPNIPTALHALRLRRKRLGAAEASAKSVGGEG